MMLPCRLRRVYGAPMVQRERIAISILVLALLFSLPEEAMGAQEADVMDVAQELACLCGSCPPRPLDECRCGYAGEQRNRIAKKLDSGMTKGQVIAGLVGEFGERIFVTPPKEGFNLMAWIMPIVGMVFGGVVVRTVLKGWQRKEASKTRGGSALSEEEDAKLAKALREDP